MNYHIGTCYFIFDILLQVIAHVMCFFNAVIPRHYNMKVNETFTPCASTAYRMKINQLSIMFPKAII